MTIAGTLLPHDAARRLWDVIVVGAGPAGSATARELARLGRRVLLVDKARFPRGKVCGCCLSGATLAALNQIGLAKLPGRLGAIPLRAMVLAAGGRSAVVALPAGVALSREAFDAELVREAIAEGVEFLPGTSAILADDSVAVSLRETKFVSRSETATLLHVACRRVELRNRDGTYLGTTRLVVAADGLASRLLALEEPAVVQSRSRIGVGVIVASAPTFFEHGTVYMACAAAGYVGLVRLEDGRLDVAAALDPVAVRERKGPGPVAADILAKANWPSIEDLDSITWRGTPPLTRRRPHLGADRLFIAGDASGYVEPITGEGIAWALHSAIALAPLAHRAVDSWDARMLDEWANLHRRLLGSRQRSCGLLGRALRSPFLTQMLIRTLAFAPALARPFVRRLNSGQWSVGSG